MTRNIKAEYLKHRDALDVLKNLPDDKLPTTEAGLKEWRTQVSEHEAEMRRLAARMQYTDKKELGLLNSQRFPK